MLGATMEGKSREAGKKSEEMVSSAVWTLERVDEGRRGNRGPMPAGPTHSLFPAPLGEMLERLE